MIRNEEKFLLNVFGKRHDTYKEKVNDDENYLYLPTGWRVLALQFQHAGRSKIQHYLYQHQKTLKDCRH